MIGVLAARTSTRYAALLGGALCLFYLLRVDTGWQGLWQAGVVDATTSLLLMAPLVILAAAVDARRHLRTATLPWSTGRRTAAARLLTLMTAAWLWPALAFAVVLLTTFVVDLAVSAYHFPGLLPVVFPFVALMLAVAIGFVLGALVPLVVAASLSLAIGYVLAVLLASTPDTRAALFTVVDGGGISPSMVLSPAALGGQLVLFIALAATLLMILVGLLRRRWSGAGWAAYAGLVPPALVATVVGALAPTERSHELHDADGPRVCRAADQVTICVWPDHEQQLATGLPVARRLGEVLRTVGLTPPTGYTDEGLRRDRGSPSYGTGTATADSLTMAMDLAGPALDYAQCGDGRQREWSQAGSDRENWLLARAGYWPWRNTDERVHAILRAPAAEQASWLTAIDPGCTR